MQVRTDATVKLSPSLLAADFARLGEQIRAVEGHVEMLHLDVMDGHFVPNITFGMPVISDLRKITDLVFDCHIMTANPDAYFSELAEAGVDRVTVHIEAATDPSRAIQRAGDCGLRFGLAVSPPTPWKAIEAFVEHCDLVLVMSVHPGFGGQSFIPEVLGKAEAARKFIEDHGLTTDIEIDGGINLENVRRARDAGVNVFVAGTAVFGSGDPAKAADDLRATIEKP